ncbi:MAG: hypothetical protein Q7T04_06740 [Dehalococcoidia bacterium]|nr:hypothetical protein [Dehalococcoidia bacterium]
MTDAAIRKAMETKELTIDNFDERALQPASYDTRLGEEAMTSSRREKINPAEKGLLIIAPGGFALVTTHERLSLSPTVAGHIGLRSYYAKRGLVREPFCTVEFFHLAEPATKPYSGESQRQAGISVSDIQNLVDAQGMTFGQVITALQDLGQNVKSLSDSVKTLKWMFPVLLAFGIAVIAVLVALK